MELEKEENDRKNCVGIIIRSNEEQKLEQEEKEEEERMTGGGKRVGNERQKNIGRKKMWSRKKR